MITEQHRLRTQTTHYNGLSLLNNSFRCGIVCDSRSITEKDFNTPQYAIVYICRGEGTYVDDCGKKLTLKSGDMFQRFPDKPHSVKLSGGTVRYYLAVPKEIYEILCSTSLRFIQSPVHRLGDRPDLRAGFNSLMEECQAEKKLFSLSIKFQKMILSCISASEEYDSPLKDSLEWKMRTAADLLAEGFDKPDPISEIAGKVGMNYHSFRRRFSSWAGMSPGQYRQNKRTERSMLFLSDFKMTISQIAELLGYSDIFTFSSQFKKKTGMSPSDFRRGL